MVSFHRHVERSINFSLTITTKYKVETNKCIYNVMEIILKHNYCYKI